MSTPPPAARRRQRARRRFEEEFLRGGLAGVGAVTLATLALAAAGALVAWLVALAY